MEQGILNILMTTPIAGVLFYIMLKLWARLAEKDAEIAKLNCEILNMEKNNIVALNNLADAVKSLKDLILMLKEK